MPQATQPTTTPRGFRGMHGDDAILIQLCREYMQLWDRERPLILVVHGADDAAGDAAYVECCSIWEAKEALAERIALIKAHTDAGVLAKAQVVANAIRHRDDNGQGEQPAERSLEERLALSLCSDMGA